MKEIRKPTDVPTLMEPSPKPPLLHGRREPTRAPFRTRLFAVLLLFAVIPSIALTVVWAYTASKTLPLVTGSSAWERVARSGEQAIAQVRTATLDSAQLRAVNEHEVELRQSVEQAKRFSFVAPRMVGLVTTGAFLEHRGAPEFEVLRNGMRTMASELERGRQRELEAERASAFRESARRFAHELKNPLTPIRFAVDRLRRSAPPELHDTVEVLAEEAAHLGRTMWELPVVLKAGNHFFDKAVRPVFTSGRIPNGRPSSGASFP